MTSLANVRLRDGRPADATQLASVFVSAWRHAYEGVVSAESLRQLDEGNVAEWLGKVMSTGESVTIVAEPENSRILGFCRYGADPNEAAKGHIFSLYVLPSAAGHGVGSRLLTAALEGLALRGLDTVTIWVFETNEPARRLYSSFGFVPDGERNLEPQYGAEEIRLTRFTGGAS